MAPPLTQHLVAIKEGGEDIILFILKYKKCPVCQQRRVSDGGGESVNFFIVYHSNVCRIVTLSGLICQNCV
jgi:hypothetical protein